MTSSRVHVGEEGSHPAMTRYARSASASASARGARCIDWYAAGIVGRQLRRRRLMAARLPAPENLRACRIERDPSRTDRVVELILLAILTRGIGAPLRPEVRPIVAAAEFERDEMIDDVPTPRPAWQTESIVDGVAHAVRHASMMPGVAERTNFGGRDGTLVRSGGRRECDSTRRAQPCEREGERSHAARLVTGHQLLDLRRCAPNS